MLAERRLFFPRLQGIQGSPVSRLEGLPASGGQINFCHNENGHNLPDCLIMKYIVISTNIHIGWARKHA